MKLLDVKNLSASYFGYEALKGVNLHVNVGEIVGLCGPNKAGKSTLCKCLAGTKSTDAGDIFFNDQRINELTVARRIALGLTLCPERSNELGDANPIYLNQDVSFNVNVLRNREPHRKWQAMVDQVLCDFGLFERKKQVAGTLSGGQTQMLGIARKLICVLSRQAGPCLLVIDEPARGLAQKTIHDLFRVLEKVRKYNVSVLLVEEVAQRLSGVDRIYVLRSGSIKFEGHVDELLKNQLESETSNIRNGRVPWSNFSNAV